MLANQNNSYASIVLVDKIIHQKKETTVYCLFVCYG
jgi:hypothetical protein